eukprot:12309129-Ditylum_brightwellii.AAC.1
MVPSTGTGKREQTMMLLMMIQYSAQDGKDGYNLVHKCNYLYNTIVHNANAVTKGASLDLIDDKAG